MQKPVGNLRANPDRIMELFTESQRQSFQLIYLVTRGIHFANPCLLRLFYIGARACRGIRPSPRQTMASDRLRLPSPKAGASRALRDVCLPGERFIAKSCAICLQCAPMPSAVRPAGLKAGRQPNFRRGRRSDGHIGRTSYARERVARRDTGYNS